MLRKYLTSAIIGIRSARIRSVLTILGITMGIFMVVTLLAVGRGAQEDVVGRITDLGANIITVQSVQETQQAKAGFPTSLVNSLAPATLTLDDLRTVEQQPGVVQAVPTRYSAGKMQNGTREVEPGFVILTNQKYEKVRELKVSSGRFFSDTSSGQPEIIIGQSIKTALFGNEDPLGKTVLFEGKKVVVVGTMTSSGTEQVDRTVIAPLALVADPAQRSLYSFIFAKVESSERVDSAVQGIKTSMVKYRESGTVTVTSSEELLNASKDVLKVLTAMIAIVAAISLTMSGVGIMNMMVVSVTDRTKEIGIRKTVGATAANIFWQFLFESVVLTLIGGVAGLVLAASAVFAISKWLPIQPLLTPGLVLLGMSLSVVVGMMFGVGPAMRAARKEPIEALQTDRS